MGMYTGLRFKVVIKPEYREILNTILNEDDFLEWGYYENTPFTKEWMNYSRSCFIPWGAICYMPDDWEDHSISNFDIKTGIWEVRCSLKNYERTIEYFLENVLSKIIMSSDLIERRYEEDEESTFYSFNKDEEKICRQ